MGSEPHPLDWNLYGKKFGSLPRIEKIWEKFVILSSNPGNCGWNQDKSGIFKFLKNLKSTPKF